jgi:hypothetical protein
MDPHFFRLEPDPNPRGKKPTKQKKSEEMSCLEVLDVLFLRLEASPVAWTSFMYRRGLGINVLQFLVRKIRFFLLTCKIFQFLVIKSLDPDPELNPDPH